jgi:hypothetical protein
MSTITGGCVFEHILRQRCPWKPDVFLQEAEDPQPCTGPSAFASEIKSIGPSSRLQRIELGPLPWQRQRCLLRYRFRYAVSAADTTRETSHEEHC